MGKLRYKINSKNWHRYIPQKDKSNTENIWDMFVKWDYLKSLETVFWEQPHLSENLKNVVIKKENREGESRAGYTERNEKEKKYIIHINIPQLQKEAISLEDKSRERNINEYFYETLFHECTHTLSLDDNTLRKSFWFWNEIIPWFKLLFEVFAQTIAQNIVSYLYKTKYEVNHCELKTGDIILNENDSNLFWYGELEPFALKFSTLLYWKENWEQMLKDYLNGSIYWKIKDKIQKEGEQFTNYLKALGIILIWDYVQQKYIDRPNWFSVTDFKSAVESFKNIE